MTSLCIATNIELSLQYFPWLDLRVIFQVSDMILMISTSVFNKIFGMIIFIAHSVNIRVPVYVYNALNHILLIRASYNIGFTEILSILKP